MKKILVIDGNSIINRAYYGVRPLTTKSGKFTNAIFGMINIIMRQMDAIAPDYAAVAFDVKAPTFRHKMYSEYKAGRHPTPEELLSQFPDAKECLSLMGLHVLELPGYEADDIQGTIAKMAHGREDLKSYILTGDRDLLQLIDGQVTVLLATNSDTLHITRDPFFEKYGIEPDEFVDMKALMGDSSDNIPGVAGVGEKTAGNLIRDFHSLDGIYENIEDKRISRGVREKLLRDKEQAYLSKTLAKINTDAPLGIELEDIAYKGIDRVGLYKKFVELELNSFITKFKLHDVPMEDATEAESTHEEFFTPLSPEQIAAFPEGRVSILEADGALFLSDGEKSYRIGAPFENLDKLLDLGREVVCYDGKKLLHTLASHGIHPARRVKLLDIQLYAYVLNPGNSGTTLTSLYSQFLGKLTSEGTPAPALLLSLEAPMRAKIAEDGMLMILEQIELPLLPILFDMEREGIRIDVAGMREFGEALGALSEELASRIYMQAGEVFNIQSPKQLGEVLFVKMGLSSKKKKTKSGYSTDAETLEELRHEAPIIEDILEYRQVTKLRSTYATALTEVADAEGRVHTDFKQALTATGRLSSADPNLQNIPIRTKMGRQMRRYFIAKDGYALVDADYSQIELRLLAHISGDYNMSEAFREGADIHTKTAAAVFGVPEEMVTDDLRKRAKAVNFGIVYGIGGFSLAKDIGTGVAQATKYIKNYMMNYPAIEVYLDEVVKRAEIDGYTTTPLGRRRYIPELKAQNGNVRAFGKRVAMNAPIQGAAADIIKIAMIRVYQRLEREGIDAKLIMQVHDELLIEAKLPYVDLCRRILKEEMENAVSLSIPLTVDVTSGTNWLDQE